MESGGGKGDRPLEFGGYSAYILELCQSVDSRFGYKVMFSLSSSLAYAIASRATRHLDECMSNATGFRRAFV